MTLLSTTPLSTACSLRARVFKDWRKACGLTCSAIAGSVALTLGLGPVAIAQTLMSQASQGVEPGTESALGSALEETPESPASGADSGPNAVSEAAVESAGEIVPPVMPNPEPEPFSPLVSGIVDLSSSAEPFVGVGHLRPSDLTSLGADDVGWLESVVLPLYAAPGGDHWGWLYQGWLVLNEQSALAIGRDAGFAMVRPYENLYTFPVLAVQPDGWVQVQYTPGGSAWVHTSHFDLGEMHLVFEDWESRMQEQTAVYFFDTQKAQALRSQPEQSTNMLGLVAADSLIEPLSFLGDWMEVRVTRPAANCRPLTGATVTEGWMRWRGSAQESLVWYRPDESCAQEG